MAILKQLSAWYCESPTQYTGITTATYTFGPSSGHWVLNCWTSNTGAMVWHVGYDLSGGGWCSRYIKFSVNTTPVLGFAHKTATYTFNDANNTYQLAVNGGVNQIVLSRSSGSTTWNFNWKNIRGPY